MEGGVVFMGGGFPHDFLNSVRAGEQVDGFVIPFDAGQGLLSHVLRLWVDGV